MLTFLIPCLNESSTIEKVVKDCCEELLKSKIKGRVLVADNGSSDGSQNLAKKGGADVINIAKRGYGSALKEGIKEIKSGYVVMLDADSTYSPSDGIKLYKKCKNGFDLVMGNRFTGAIKLGAMPFLHKYLGNPVLSWLGKLFYSIKVGDFHCGIRCFRAESMLSLSLDCPGMEFASEMVIRSALMDFSITEVPVTLYPNPPGRKPHLRTWRDGWRHLIFMLSFAPKWSILPLVIFQSFLSLIFLLTYALDIFPFSGYASLIGSFLLGLLAQASAGFFSISRLITRSNKLITYISINNLDFAKEKKILSQTIPSFENQFFTPRSKDNYYSTVGLIFIFGLLIGIATFIFSNYSEFNNFEFRNSKTYALLAFTSFFMIGSSIIGYSYLCTRKAFIYNYSCFRSIVK